MDDVDIRHGTSVRLEQHVCPRAVHDWVIAKQPSCIRYHTHIILIILYQTISYHTILYHTTLFHICHTISSCCILPYLTHTILYHTINKSMIAKQSLHPITNPSTITTIITNISIHLSTLDPSTLPFICQKSFSKKYFSNHQLCHQY